MDNFSHRFQVGTFECLAINDGMFPYSAPLFFPAAPDGPLAAALERHGIQPEPIPSPWPCLTVNTGERRVLIDTGGGAMASQVVPGAGRVPECLTQHGFALESIDTVILTHGHPDHIGGLTDGKGQLVYPNARYVMWRTEWEFWTAESTLAGLDASADHLQHLLAAFARASLPPLRDRLQLIDRETEVVPGLHAFPAPGHTPGHMALAITSGTSQLLDLADTVLHPIHLEQPDWYPVFDALPDQAAQTKRRLMDRAAADRALVHLSHFPFPGLGHIVQRGGAWEWQPIEARPGRAE
jgi:glyoxylase-like metal-dependent hydrolase (beta-lactamase superfamily II)